MRFTAFPVSEKIKSQALLAGASKPARKQRPDGDQQP
jgi:hypothetical protein